MLFPTFTFALFFVVVLTAGWLMPGRRGWWKLFMLAASYFFYGYWDARFVGLIVASTVVNQAAATWLGRLQRPGARRAVVSVAVGANLASLGFFKYAGFFVDSAESALEGLGVSANLPLLNIILPVGISFFTFQAISYVLDVYRGDTEPAKPLDFAVYLAFFPQLVAGPIVRANELIPQLNQPRALRHTDFTRAVTLIAAGLFKKMVVATYLAEALVDDVFAFPDRFSSLEVLLGVYGYAVQIYADFSGYTDIAIGVALLMGIRLPDNFDQPYRAATIQDFWRRWHMSLSRWLRDYLYIPLGGNRGGEWRPRPQPVPHDAPRRPVARRRLDLRAVGRLPRPRPAGRAAHGAAAPPRHRLARHLPLRLLRLDPVPRRVSEHRRRPAAATLQWITDRIQRLDVGAGGADRSDARLALLAPRRQRA